MRAPSAPSQLEATLATCRSRFRFTPATRAELNGSGDVVGVVVATASALSFLKGTGTLPQNVSWAVKGAFAVPLFDTPPPLPRVTERSRVVERALKATCSVTASSDIE